MAVCELRTLTGFETLSGLFHQNTKNLIIFPSFGRGSGLVRFIPAGSACKINGYKKNLFAGKSLRK
jgi:hypothetical protein